jgi:hypothetical protein
MHRITQRATIALAAAGLAVLVDPVASGQVSPSSEPKGETGNSVPIRKVQKLKDGRITAYPELVFELSPYREPAADVIGKLVTDDPNVPSDDIRQLRLVAVQALARLVELDVEVLKVGSWDVGFVTRFQTDLEKLSSAAAITFPDAKVHLPWLRYGVATAYRIESAVEQQLNRKDTTLRKQHLDEATATRLRLELALRDAEVATANPPRVGAKTPGSDSAVRKVHKRPITAYPEIVRTPYAWTADDKIGKLVTTDTGLAEGDIRRLAVEQVNRLYAVLQDDREKTKQFLDPVFLNRFLADVERLSAAAVRAFPDPDRHLPWIRYTVGLCFWCENGVLESFSTTGSLRSLYYLQVFATRVTLEQVLFDAETAAKKKDAGR